MKLSQKDRILLLDCDHKNALAIVRHLGRKKRYHIDVVAYNKPALAFFSKYSDQKFIIRNPKHDPEGYMEDLLGLIGKNKYVALIPVSYISYQICALNRNRILEHTGLTIASAEQISLASDKIRTYNHAAKLGVPYPEMIVPGSQEELDDLVVSFPCVIKAAAESGNSIVDYANNREELIDKYKKICKRHSLNETLPIIQKFIKGEGAGFFAFYQKGQCRNFFIHRRIREYPASGGPSTCAESWYNEEIYSNGKKILDSLNWEGVAMVEFKKDNSTGIFNLMEINAKLWGSLDLALAAGADFPQMLIDSATGMEVREKEYKRNVRFQWLLNGDLFHLFQRPWHLPAFIRDLFISKNDIYISDPLPNLFQLIYIPVHYYKKWFR